MKITALLNFRSNGVDGFPGKVLTSDECNKVQNVLDEMKLHGLVSVEEGQPSAPLEEVPVGSPSEGIVDDGPDSKDDLPDSPDDDASDASQEKSPSKGKKKKS